MYETAAVRVRWHGLYSIGAPAYPSFQDSGMALFVTTIDPQSLGQCSIYPTGSFLLCVDGVAGRLPRRDVDSNPPQMRGETSGACEGANVSLNVEFAIQRRRSLATGETCRRPYRESNRTSSRSIMAMVGRPEAAMLRASSVCRISTTVCTPSAP